MKYFALVSILLVVPGQGISEDRREVLEIRKQIEVQSFCLEGQVFVVIYNDSITPRTLALTQVYEDKDGKSLPKSCGD